MLSLVAAYAAVELMMMLRTILQPLLFAFFLVMILVPLMDQLTWVFLGCRRTRPGEEATSWLHSIAFFSALLIIMACFAMVVFALGVIVFQGLVQMRSNFLVYEKGAAELAMDVKALIAKMATAVHIRGEVLERLTDDMGVLTYEALFSSVAELLADMQETMVRGVLCGLYLLFWLCDPIRIDNSIDELFQKYFLMKTVANFCMGLSSGILLYAVDVDMCWTFALLTFVLNYIPEIGPLIAATLPTPVILLDGRVSTRSRVITLCVVMVGQLVFKFFFGNVMEMKMIEADRKMRMHPVIVLLGVAFFGYIWGPTGMLMSVPLMALLKVLCIDKTSPMPPHVRSAVLIFLEGDVNAPEKFAEAEALVSVESSDEATRAAATP